MSKYAVLNNVYGTEKSVSEGVMDELYDTGCSGIAEDALSTATNSAEAIGMLVEMLSDKGVLTKEDVKKFVGYREVVENTNAT